MDKYIQRAIRLCHAHKYESKDFYLCAIIVKGGKILSVGYSGSPTGSFIFENSHRGLIKKRPVYALHAEMDAIFRARSDSLEGAKMYVVRLRSSGELACSRPCIVCQNMLFRYGIRRVCYTMNDSSLLGLMKIEKNGTTTDKIVSMNDG